MYVMILNGEAVVIDPCEDKELINLFEDNHITIVHVLLTHEHYDHVSGIKWLKDNYQTILYCQRQCAEVLVSKKGSNPALVALVFADQDKQDGGHRYLEFKSKFEPYSVQADRVFDTYDSFRIGDFEIEGTSTPGHSPGCACYQLNDDIVFTGDSLLQYDPVIITFADSRKNLYDEKTLPYLRSLKNTMVALPGHGNPFILSETKNI